MRKSLAVLGPVAMTCVALTCAACASSPDRGPEGPGGPEAGPPMAPGLFVSPFGEPFRSQQGEPYPVSAWFAGADADHDGKLTRAEFMADGVRWFDQLDTNKDGIIGQAEIVAYETLTSRLTGGMRGPGGGPGGGMGGPGGGGWGGPPGGGASLADDDQEGGMGGPPGGGGRGGRGGSRSGGEGQHSGPRGGGAATSVLALAGLLNVPEPVKAADVDVNQRITPDEWSRAGDRWFDLLDADRDGVLTLAELPKTQLQQHGGRRGPGHGGRRGRRQA
jgi:hypothetical protein